MKEPKSSINHLICYFINKYMVYFTIFEPTSNQKDELYQ